MVDVTLLEVNLEDAEFTANAPFSGREGKGSSGSKVSKMLKRSGESKSGESGGSTLSKLTSKASEKREEAEDDGVEIDIGEDSEDNPASFTPVLLLGALVAAVVVLRRLRRSRSEGQHELVEYETEA